VAEYFDFLEAYGKKIDRKLKNQPPVTELVHKARCAAISSPSDALHWCRLVGEAMVDSYDGGSNEKMSLRLFGLRNEGIITPQQAQWLKSIWAVGSEYGSHANSKASQKDTARKTLEVIKLLDSCLRCYIKNKIDNAYEIDSRVNGDPLINQSRDEAIESVQAVSSDSAAVSKHSAEIKKLNDELGVISSEEDSIRAESSQALSELTALENKIVLLNNDKSADVGLIAELASALASGGALSDEDKLRLAAASARIAEADNLEKQADSLADNLADDLIARQRLQNDYDGIKARADEILAEYDWIARMLNGRGQATKRQRDVINRNYAMLHIRGGAGTGKSLVLLTKCLRELDREAFDFQQESMFAAQQEGMGFNGADWGKTALLVTYNKSLKKYLSDILQRLSSSESVTDTVKRAIKNITVVNYDSFINTVLRPFSQAYSHSRVIYQKGSKNEFGTLDYIKELLGNESSMDACYFYDEEFTWIASLGDMSLERYLAIDRRGNRDLKGLDLNKGSDGRKAVFALYEKFKAALSKDGRYLVSDLTLDLLRGEGALPRYDIVAIDEAQDFDLVRIKLIYNLRKDESAKFYIVYDEGQKINKTTFSAEGLDVSLPKFAGGHSAVFDVNHRNHEDIAAFANRMKDGHAPLPDSSDVVVVERREPEHIVTHIASLPFAKESIAVLVSTNAEVIEWTYCFDTHKIPYHKLGDGDDVTQPGIYFSTLWAIKGLEFDRVIIPQMNEDKSYYFHRTERDNLYFVAFTRARKALEIYYQGTPHAILVEKYEQNPQITERTALSIQAPAEPPPAFDDDIPF
jgi:superfamily I DNA/RNA helicase